MTETWKPVPGYEGLYEVSNFGNVRSVDRILSDGRSWHGRVVHGGLFSNGYRFICCRKNWASRNELVHRLVALAFVPNPKCFSMVNHIDGDKTNNAASYLEWVDGSENQKHAVRTGLRRTKLTANDIDYVKRELRNGRSQESVSEELGVSQVLISQALLGKISYLSEEDYHNGKN